MIAAVLLETEFGLDNGWGCFWAYLLCVRNCLDLKAPLSAGDLFAGIPQHNRLTPQIENFSSAAGGMGSMGGNNPFANAFGSDMMARLSVEPKFVPYLADPSFVAKLKMLQQDPNNVQMHLSDPRIMEVNLVRNRTNLEGPHVLKFLVLVAKARTNCSG